MDQELEEKRHREHFEEFDRIARLIGIERLIRYIPATREEVAKALKTDEHLNNIPLAKWDAQHISVQQMGRAAKAGWGESKTAWALCETVCTLKHVARHYYVKSAQGWHSDRRDLGEFLKVGDYVDQEMADYFLGVLPPACMTGGIIQIGEPHSHVNGRATFATIRETVNGWQYCGNCYRGQVEEPKAA